MVPFKRAIIVSYRLFIVTNPLSLIIYIRPQFAVECLHRSSQHGLFTLGQNLKRKGLTDVSQILTRSGREVWAVYPKQIVWIFSAV